MASGGVIKAPLRTVVFGAGNVASHLVPALEESGAIEVSAVWSRTEEHASELASRLRSALPVCSIDAVPDGAELYLVSVADDMVRRIAAEYNGGHDAVWLHTSGSVPASALERLTEHYGVLYPLQTFSRGTELDLKCVPFFIEGSDESTLSTARYLAEKVSTRVYEADSDLRARMHVAAVFGCNFTNFMWTVADGLLRRNDGLDITVIEPLLKETLRKCMAIGPGNAQTGPAMRGDSNVIDKHISMLDPELADMYKYLTEKIISYYDERN